MNRTLNISLKARKGSRGFTAVEIAMVATVIAILALLILPIYRDRVEAARQAAVVDELSSIAKAQLLIEADVNMQARLQDLDNTSTPDTNPDLAIPYAAWNGTLEANVPKARATLFPGADGEGGWQGPYTTMKNYETVQNLQDYWYDSPRGIIGFIYVVGNGQGPAYPDGTEDEVAFDRYPVDPWGNPYIFYGKGRFPNDADPGVESYFTSSLAYSLGPNGLPNGAVTAFAPADIYTRQYLENNLGTGDDVDYRF